MLSLYTHIPFCVRKCHYCGFYSTKYSFDTADAYIDSLRQEASACRTMFETSIFDTVYFGGGTPTVLSREQLDRLISVVKEHFHIAVDAELTIEANPNSLSPSHLGLLKDRGVNRLSLGIQSFSDDILGSLGRLHTAKQAVDSFLTARNAGFSNISVDLIYGIPGLSMNQWDRTLEIAVELKPEHISAYSLSLDQGSRLREEADAGKFSLPDDDTVAGQYERTVQKLAGAGYVQYEISNFSLPGFACRHNKNYWKRGEYLGVGPGAWSFVNGRRYHNIADVHEYCRRLKNGLPVVEGEECVNARQAANEAVMLALRTASGLDVVWFQREFGDENLHLLKEKISDPLLTGLIQDTNQRISLSKSGFLLANQVLERLIL